jgi:hypothetical protein
VFDKPRHAVEHPLTYPRFADNPKTNQPFSISKLRGKRPESEGRSRSGARQTIRLQHH